MPLDEFLRQRADSIVDEAVQSVRRSRLENYEAAGPEITRERLRKLLDLTISSVGKRMASEMREYAERLARERHAAGFDLHEVQTAINVLEEAVWKRILAEMEPARYAEALGLVSTVLGVAKDTLARTYVTLASKRRSPSLDLRAIFAGTDGV